MLATEKSDSMSAPTFASHSEISREVMLSSNFSLQLPTSSPSPGVSTLEQSSQGDRQRKYEGKRMGYFIQKGIRGKTVLSWSKHNHFFIIYGKGKSYDWYNIAKRQIKSEITSNH